MKCERCGNEHDGSYGSGRFCSAKCARGFATQEERQNINKKVRTTLTGKPSKLKGRRTIRWNVNTNLKVSASLKSYHERKKQLIMKSLPFEKWPKVIIKRFLFKEVGNRCKKCGFEYTDPVTGKGHPVFIGRNIEVDG